MNIRIKVFVWFLLFICFLAGCHRISVRTPCIFDRPDKGLYSGFLINNTDKWLCYLVFDIKDDLKFSGHLAPMDYLEQDVQPAWLHPLLLSTGKYYLYILFDGDDIEDISKIEMDIPKDHPITAEGPFIWLIETVKLPNDKTRVMAGLMSWGSHGS